MSEGAGRQRSAGRRPAARKARADTEGASLRPQPAGAGRGTAGAARPVPRRGGLSSMEEALEGFLRASGLDRRLSTHRVMAAWAAAVGEPLARRARAVRFEQGELTVEVLSAAHLQELANFTGEAYRVAANRRLGGERIRRVVFKLKR